MVEIDNYGRLLLVVLHLSKKYSPIDEIDEWAGNSFGLLKKSCELVYKNRRIYFVGFKPIKKN